MVVLFSRIQFALTIAFHFLFVPLTIGLILLTAIFEGLHFFKRDKLYKQIADFWGELFVINYAVGIVTGIVMSVQFGTNWSGYSVFMGDVFGSPLAFEALLAFFLESTFTGIWAFKRRSLGAGLRFLTVCLITLGTMISALWIITANGFMQHPVGYELTSDGTKVIMNDFYALMTNPYSLYMLTHTLLAAILLGALFVIGVSAYHFKHQTHVEFFKKSVRIAVILGLIVSIIIPFEGNHYAKYVGRNDVQPLKGAILRGKISDGDEVKHEAARGDEAEIDARSSATLEKATESLNALERKPPAEAVYFAFMLMQILGGIFIVFLLIATVRPSWLISKRWLQNIALWMIPLPYIAILAGWFVAEVGRQPWMVYNLLTVENGISDVPWQSVLFSLFALCALYIVLFVIDFYLIRKKSIQGPAVKGGEHHV